MLNSTLCFQANIRHSNCQNQIQMPGHRRILSRCLVLVDFQEIRHLHRFAAKTSSLGHVYMRLHFARKQKTRVG